MSRLFRCPARCREQIWAFRRPEQLNAGSVPPGTAALCLEDGLQVSVTLKMMDDSQE